MNENKVTAKNLLKFILGSAFGILMFLVPVPKDDSFTTLLDFIKGYIKTLFGNTLPYVLMVLMIISGVLTLIQIIYLTEVGTIIIKSEIPLNLWKLFVVFLERTLIAIPILVLLANLFCIG